MGIRFGSDDGAASPFMGGGAWGLALAPAVGLWRQERFPGGSRQRFLVGSVALGIAMGLSLGLQVLVGLVVAVLPVRVTTSDGQRVEGTYAGMESSAVVLDQNGQATRLAFDNVLSMEPREIPAETGPPIRVELRSGSRIAAEQVSLAEEQLRIAPRQQEAFEVPLEQVGSIRFQPASAATDAQWLGMLEDQGRGDLMAVRRQQDQLDQIRGVVEGIGDGTVQFTIGGQSVDAPIERLEGLVFSGDGESPEAADVLVQDIYGSRWAARALLPSGAEEPLRLKLSDTLTHEVPLDQVRSIQWSGSRVLLAAQQPAEQSYEAHLPGRIDRSLMQAWFGPRSDDPDSLILHGGSAVEYRIPEGFQTLAGTVRRAESVERGGAVTVKILLDGESVWSETITDDAARGFELPLGRAARVRIEAASGGDGDLGDTIRISRPRLLK